MTMMKKYCLLCLLSVLCLSMTCDEDSFCDMTGVAVTVIDNSGETFREVDDGQCPKEAMILQIEPEWDATGYNSGKLTSPIVGLRIITLNDFDDSHKAGSDVSEYFKTYPRELCPNENTVYDSLENGTPIDSWQTGYSCFKALLKAPAPGDYAFRIDMKLKDSETLTCTTQSIHLY